MMYMEMVEQFCLSSNNLADGFFLNLKFFYFTFFYFVVSFIYVDYKLWFILTNDVLFLYFNKLADIDYTAIVRRFSLFQYADLKSFTGLDEMHLILQCRANWTRWDFFVEGFFDKDTFFKTLWDIFYFLEEKLTFLFFFYSANQYIFSIFTVIFVLFALNNALSIYKLLVVFYNKSYYFFTINFYLKIRSMVAGMLNYSLRELTQTVKFAYAVGIFFTIYIFNVSNLISEFSNITSYITYTSFFTFIIILNLFFQIFKVYSLSSLKKFSKIDDAWHSSIYPCIMSFFTFFFRILSLCIRLFVNMLAGHLLVDIIQYFIFLSSFFDFYTLFC